MKRRMFTLAVTAALALSLLGMSALAVEGDIPAPELESAPVLPEGGEDAPVEEPPEDAPQADDLGTGSGSGPVNIYIPDPAGTISFQNVEDRMREGNLQVLALQENVDMLAEIDYEDLREDLRLQLNQIAKGQWMMVQMGQSGTLAYERMDQAYDAVREQFDAIKDGDMQADNADTIRQLQSLQNQIVMAGEATYIALSAMDLQEAGLQRQLAALDRAVTEMRLRYDLGQISALQLSQTEAGRTSLNSGLATLQMNLNTYKGQLELLVGAEISGEIALGPVPEVSAKELAAMDLEADLETAKANSWDLYEAEQTLEDDHQAYKDAGGYSAHREGQLQYEQAQHTWKAAQHTYHNTVQNFELAFRNLYLQVKDYAQVLSAARTALAVEEDSLAAARLKYQQGTISQNALLEAEDKVKTAQEKVDSAGIDLFSSYNTYRWAVDHGILN